MKPNAIQHEILLMATTTICKRQLCEINNFKKSYLAVSPIEQVAQAYWNRMLYELVPEIMERSGSGANLFIWYIRQGTFYLQIELSESTVLLERQLSIDANLFLSKLLYN